jgi:hypothetical protein
MAVILYLLGSKLDVLVAYGPLSAVQHDLYQLECQQEDAATSIGS